MFADLMLGMLGPLAAKRFAFVRKALWIVLAVFVAGVTYGMLY